MAGERGIVPIIPGNLGVKCQISIEFIFLVGFLLFMFVVMSGIVAYNTSYMLKRREVITAEDIATKVQKEINLAVSVLDGYSREFSIPQKIESRDYNIFIVGNEVILRTEKQDFWRVIPDVAGNISRGKNIIRRVNGTIYLN